MNWFDRKTKVRPSRKAEFCELVRESFPAKRVGEPARFYDEFEMALAFAAAIRWMGQERFLHAKAKQACCTFIENRNTTGPLAAVYCFMICAQNSSLREIIWRIRPEWKPNPEVRAVLRLEKSPNQGNHLVNAVVSLCGVLVQEIVTGSSSRIGSFFSGLSDSEKIDLIKDWLSSDFGFTDEALAGYLGPDLLKSLGGQTLAFDIEDWNDIVDASPGLSISASYHLDELSPTLEKLAQQRKQ